MSTKRLVLAAVVANTLGCLNPPIVSVEAPPCECACEFKATSPQVGRGCWVQGDTLVCPLVRRTLELEPAFPGEDPRCTKQEDGTIRCEVRD